MSLGHDMVAERDSLDRLATGYRMTGAADLARKASFAAQAMTAAINARAIYKGALTLTQAAVDEGSTDAD